MKTMHDKQISLSEFISEIRNGDVIVTGGWGPTRKPMTLIKEIARSNLRDLTLISYGALDMDLLIGAGKLRKLIFGFASLEFAPGKLINFMRARQEGTIEIREISEGMMWAGWKAAAERLPFYPTRDGLGTDLLAVNPDIVTFAAPYTQEKLVAMPALTADIALLHVNAADPSGYGLIIGDPYFDHLIARTAKKVFLSTEKIVPLAELKTDLKQIIIKKIWTTGVVEAPKGAHPGECSPEYSWDTKYLRDYTEAAADLKSFESFLRR